MNRRTLISAFALVPLLFYSAPGFAASSEIDTGAMAGVALGGNDAVSYFSGAPAPGKAEFSTSWKGAEWHFANAANRDAFSAAPEKYAPQYGGYCAFAVSKGSTAPGDPKVWTLHEGKLYMNLSPAVKSRWSKDIAGNISAANANWPKVLN